MAVEEGAYEHTGNGDVLSVPYNNRVLSCAEQRSHTTEPVRVEKRRERTTGGDSGWRLGVGSNAWFGGTCFMTTYRIATGRE